MSDTVVKVEGVSKRFCKSLKHTMLYGAADLAKSFVGLPMATDRLRDGEFWALQDIDFELKRGECLGLIGPNGAGKSTLLKILNGIMAPDRGRVEITGRVGALIEVGAGFHPMLTGRENIYVNGAILGLTKPEIDRNLDAIIDFSGLESFIDSPVKHYSSGMFVRLGFAIAVHVQPDVLLIDEILAVGDVGFRSRCYNIISEISKNAAVVYVSHATGGISRICTQTIVLDFGQKVFQGNTGRGIQKYQSLFPSTAAQVVGSGRAKILDLRFLEGSGKQVGEVHYNLPLVVEIDLEIDPGLKRPVIFVGFYDQGLTCIAEINSHNNKFEIRNETGRMKVRLEIDQFFLNPGIYKVSCCVYCERMQEHCAWHFAAWELRVTGDFVGMNSVQMSAQWLVEPI